MFLLLNLPIFYAENLLSQAAKEPPAPDAAGDADASGDAAEPADPAADAAPADADPEVGGIRIDHHTQPTNTWDRMGTCWRYN